MPRKPNGSDGRPANDELGYDGPGEMQRRAPMTRQSAEMLSMTTSPAFDLWLDRQMKTLLAACDDTPNQALLDLIRREFSKRDGKVTE